MHINGSNLMMFVTKDGKLTSVACATNHTLDVQTETISTSCKDSSGGKWDTSEPGMSSWSMTTENLCSDCSKGVSEADLFEMMLSRLPVVVCFGLEGDSANLLEGKVEAPAAGYKPSDKYPQYKGSAYITSFQKTAQNGQLATFSVTFTGTGKLEKTGAIAALPTKKA